MKQREPRPKTVDCAPAPGDLSLGQAAARFRAEAAVELDPTPTPQSGGFSLRGPSSSELGFGLRQCRLGRLGHGGVWAVGEEPLQFFDSGRRLALVLQQHKAPVKVGRGVGRVNLLGLLKEPFGLCGKTCLRVYPTLAA